MTDAQLEAWEAENESVEDFLAGAAAWRADPGRRDDGLMDLARRMLYRVMKNASFDMTAQTFGKWSGVRVFSLLQARIKLILIYQRRQQLSAAMEKEAGHYASLAVLSAHPGFTAVTGGITSPFWAWFDESLERNQPIRAWFSAPFQLRIQDCEAAFRRVAATAVATGYVEEFLQRATTWRLYPGRGEDELRDSARQMIRWMMRNLRLDMALPDFPCVSRNLVWTLLTNKIQGILSTSQRATEVVRKAAESFATLAIIGADPTFNAVFGDTTSLAEAWSGSPLLNMSLDDLDPVHAYMKFL